MNKYGIIDMGTNSIRLMLAKTLGNDIIHSEKYLEMTRLGQGVDETKKLSEPSMKDTVEAIIKFKQMAQAFGVESIDVLATSAVRDAENRIEFVNRIKEDSNLDVKVISGVEEAELGFVGVSAGIEAEGDILVIDIGGGSTEFIIGGDNHIKFSVSEDVGAVRMTGKHVYSDIIKSSEKENLIKDIDGIINRTIELVKKHNYSKIVGIGGTITTISAIKQKLSVYDSGVVHNSEVNQKDIDQILDILSVSTNEERKNIAGLEPKRADIIFAGIIILERILKMLGKEKLIVSDFDNLEGCLYKKHLLNQNRT